jgi:hypothetical protein
MRPLRISLALAVPAAIAAMVAAVPATPAGASPASAPSSAAPAPATSPSVKYHGHPMLPATHKPPPLQACPDNTFLIWITNGSTNLAIKGNGNGAPITVVSSGAQCFSAIDPKYSTYYSAYFYLYKNQNGYCMSWNSSLGKVVMVASCGEVTWNYWNWGSAGPKFIINGYIDVSENYCLIAYSFDSGSQVTMDTCDPLLPRDLWNE